MTLIKVLPPSAKVPGEAARAGEASDARHRTKRESGGNMLKTRQPSRGESTKRGGVGQKRKSEQLRRT